MISSNCSHFRKVTMTNWPKKSKCLSIKKDGSSGLSNRTAVTRACQNEWLKSEISLSKWNLSSTVSLSEEKYNQVCQLRLQPPKPDSLSPVCTWSEGIPNNCLFIIRLRLVSFFKEKSWISLVWRSQGAKPIKSNLWGGERKPARVTRHLVHQKPFHETPFTLDTLDTRHLLHEATFYTTHPFTPDTF